MNRMTYYLAGTLAAFLAAEAAPAHATTGTACQLKANGNGVKHVVYLQFDNVHLRRDNPNVPSDLEQMPNLLHFLEQQGTLLTNHHTPLISHTSVDILTSLSWRSGSGSVVLHQCPLVDQFSSHPGPRQ